MLWCNLVKKGAGTLDASGIVTHIVQESPKVLKEQESSQSCWCSLVKKDAGMLDAFGKGASEDIQLAKSELYSQMTWDKDSKSSSFTESQVTTLLPSPPPSPKPRKSSLEDTSKPSLEHHVCGCMHAGIAHMSVWAQIAALDICEQYSGGSAGKSNSSFPACGNLGHSCLSLFAECSGSGFDCTAPMVNLDACNSSIRHHLAPCAFVLITPERQHNSSFPACGHDFFLLCMLNLVGLWCRSNVPTGQSKVCQVSFLGGSHTPVRLLTVCTQCPQKPPR